MSRSSSVKVSVGRCGPSSRTTTEKPDSASSAAATAPPAPDPTTTTSHSRLRSVDAAALWIRPVTSVLLDASDAYEEALGGVPLLHPTARANGWPLPPSTLA